MIRGSKNEPKEEVPSTYGGVGGQDPPVPEQLRVQTEIDEEEEQLEQPKPAPPGVDRQLLVVMRHGQRIDEVDKEWSAQAKRPYDPYLTEHGEKQAKAVGPKLQQFDIKKVYISPFYRCLQTAMGAMETVQVPPEDWTVSCAVSEFLNPSIMVKKGGSVPPGNINEWFFKGGDLKSHVKHQIPQDIANKVKIGRTRFEKYPENLLSSRRRYIHAFQEAADQANGQNVLIVTHGDAVNASVSRLWPWAIVHPVLHTGFTVAARERKPDGNWSKWKMLSHSGESGVWWRTELQPAFYVFKFANNIIKAGRKGVTAATDAVSKRVDLRWMLRVAPPIIVLGLAAVLANKFWG